MLQLWHVAIPVSNLERSVEFYTQHLGFRLLGYDEYASKKQAFVELGEGGVNLELFEPKVNVEQVLMSRPDHLAFEVEDMEQFRNHLTKCNAKAPHFDTYDTGMKCLKLSDPDGIPIEIFQGRKIYETYLKEMTHGPHIA